MDEDLLSAFREDAASALEVLRPLVRTWAYIDTERAEAHLLEAFRIFHNLKGAADVLGLSAMHVLAQAAEECIENHFAKRQRPDTEVIAELARAIETMVEHVEGDVTSTGLDMMAMSLTDAAPGEPSERGALRLEARLSIRAPAPLHGLVAEGEPRATTFPAEAVPLSRALRSYHFIVARTAESLGKEARLEAEVGEVRVTRAVLGALREPMMHLLRNAVDHGIEHPLERRRKSKPERGTITLRAEEHARTVQITLTDDGRGLDRQALLRNEAPAPSRAALLERLFEPGVTSRARAGPVSGRGIGLDAARARLAALGGTLDAFEDEQRRLTFRIVLPRGTDASHTETDL